MSILKSWPTMSPRKALEKPFKLLQCFLQVFSRKIKLQTKHEHRRFRKSNLWFLPLHSLIRAQIAFGVSQILRSTDAIILRCIQVEIVRLWHFHRSNFAHRIFSRFWHIVSKTGSEPGLDILIIQHGDEDRRISSSTLFTSPTNQGGTSFPSQSQHFPLPSTPTSPTTSINLSATHSLSNNFSFLTLPQKSLLKSVFTVPGCSATAIAFSPDAVFK